MTSANPKESVTIFQMKSLHFGRDSCHRFVPTTYWISRRICIWDQGYLGPDIFTSFQVNSPGVTSPPSWYLLRSFNAAFRNSVLALLLSCFWYISLKLTFIQTLPKMCFNIQLRTNFIFPRALWKKQWKWDFFSPSNSNKFITLTCHI